MPETPSINDTLADIDETGLGAVYLLRRNSKVEIIKIGHTSRTAESRATNYTDGEWIVHQEYTMPIWLAKLTERRAHANLAQYWLDPKMTGGSASEIFTCSTEQGEIAIQLAFIEELEKSLRLLGLPTLLVDTITREREMSSNVTITALERRLGQLMAHSQTETLQLKQELLDLKAELELERQKSNEDVAALRVENSGLSAKVHELEKEITSLKSKKSLATSDFKREIDALATLSDKKINPKDFDLLRDGFRRAMTVITQLRT
jgi:hypothetical protein